MASSSVSDLVSEIIANPSTVQLDGAKMKIEDAGFLSSLQETAVVQHFLDPLYLLTIPYIVGQPLFRRFVQTTDVYEKNKKFCKMIMCVYNLAMAAFSLYACVVMVYAMCTELPAGVYGLGHYESETYARISNYFYLSKYFEYLDTYFLILCNRPVIWLQFLHHIGAPLDVGVWHNNQVEGTWIYVVFNGFIHTVMYYYYACCIMKWPFPWKQMITNLQLLQFVSGLCVVLPYLFVPGFWEDDAKRTAFLFNYGYVLMNLTMFINFYRQTYLLKKKANQHKQKGKDEQHGAALLGKNGNGPLELQSQTTMNNKGNASCTGSSVATQEVAEKKDSSIKGKDLVIYYKGQPIRITEEWQRKHPGGVKVLRIFHLRDATDVMLAMHSDQARRLIETMAKVSSPEPELAKIPHEPSLYEQLWETAQKRGLFRAQVGSEMWKAFYSFGFVFVGMYFVCASAGGAEPRFFGGLLSMAFGWYQLGWLGHDWSHHTMLVKSTTQFCRVNDWMAWALTIVRPTSVLSWKLRHNTHHAVTNEIDNDPDIKLSPVLHFFEDFTPGLVTKLQHLYFLPLVGLVPLLFWHVESWIASTHHWSSKNKVTRAHARWDVLALLLHYACIVAPIFYCCGCTLFTFAGLAGAYYLSGLASGVVVFASHYGEERLSVEDFETFLVKRTATSNCNSSTAHGLRKESNEEQVGEQEAPQEEPPASEFLKIRRIGLLEETARTVRNIRSFSRTKVEEDAWFWLTGGLNTQFEHHLFPLMPRCNLRQMTSLVKEVCGEHQIRFAEDNLKDCVSICFRLLKENVQRNMCRLHMFSTSTTTPVTTGTSGKIFGKPNDSTGVPVEVEESDCGETQLCSAERSLTTSTKLSKSVHTEASFRQSTSTLMKAFLLLVLGFLFTTSFSSPVGILCGVFLSCVAFAGIDCVRGDCAQNVFSPSSLQNRILGALLERRNVFALTCIGTVAAMGLLHRHAVAGEPHLLSCLFVLPTWETVLFSMNYFVVPLVLMRLNQWSRAEKKRAGFSHSASGTSSSSSSDEEEEHHLSRTASVDKLAPGLTKKLQKWARVLEKATRPRATDLLGGQSRNLLRSGTTSPAGSGNRSALHHGLPFAKNRLAQIPMYRVKNWMRAVEKDLESCYNNFLVEQEQQVVDLSADQFLRASAHGHAAPSCTIRGLEVLGDLSPAFANISRKQRRGAAFGAARDVDAAEDSTSKMKHINPASLLKKPASDVSIATSSASSGDCSDFEADSDVVPLARSSSNGSCDHEKLLGAEDKTVDLSSDSAGEDLVMQLPLPRSLTCSTSASSQEDLWSGDEEEEDEAAERRTTVGDLVSFFLRLLLAPVQLGFEKIFFSGDFEFYLVISVYLLMVYVGSFYFAYTPVCIVMGLLGPRTAGPKFLERQFLKLEQAIMEQDESEYKYNKAAQEHGGDASATAGARSKTKTAGIFAFGHRLNVFMCFYLGINHLLALHACVVLLCMGGKDLVLQLLDTGIRVVLVHAGILSEDAILSPTDLAAPVKWQTLALSLALWPISGLGITAGAHRLWAHKSYEAGSVARCLLMLFNSIANQGSIFHWARDHRTHHLHSDTGSDPHDSNRGWFYSHMGWLLVEKPEPVRLAGRKVDVTDLQADAFVQFQKKTDPWWNFAWCFAVPAFVAVFAWDETLWNGFLYAGVLRYVYVLHCTWAVNSIVHTDFGPSPYDPEHPPSESRLVSFLAMGEGWHSWHHAFAFDYATAELGCLQQWNPTKLFIDLLAAFGLVKNRKRGTRMWTERKNRMQKKAADRGEVMIESLSGPPLCKVRNLKFEPVVKQLPREQAEPTKVASVGADMAEGGQLRLQEGKEPTLANFSAKSEREDDFAPTKNASAEGAACLTKMKTPSSVSAGALDLIEDIKEWEAATNYLTKEKVMAAIPARLKKRSAFWSASYLFRDCVYCAGIYYAFRFHVIPFGADVLGAPRLLLNVVYAALMGTAATGVWVVGHECGHGAFSESSLLNDVVGFVTHTVLLVPYFAWQFTHAKHHKYTNHLTLGETHVPPAKPTWLHKLSDSLKHVPVFSENFVVLLDLVLHLVLGWPMYLVFNLTGGRVNWRGQKLNKKKNVTHFYAGASSEIFPPSWHLRVNLSAVGLVLMAGLLAAWAQRAGVETVLVYYFGPYLVTNMWLVLYTWLQHTDEEVPHFGPESFSWLRGALCTIDRPYPKWIDHLHHKIGSTHVMHHLNFKIPHYHAAEATECVKPLLGSLYRFDPRPVFSEVLCNVIKTCEHVNGVHGVQFYQSTSKTGGIANSMKQLSKSGTTTSHYASTSSISSAATPKKKCADEVEDGTTVKKMIRSPTTGMLHPVEFPAAAALILSTDDSCTSNAVDTKNVIMSSTSAVTLLKGQEEQEGSKMKKPEEATQLVVGLDAKPDHEAKKEAAEGSKKIEIFIDGKIVDVTSYTKKHPGGRILEFMAGTDGTDAFAQFHHRSAKAAKILAKLPKREPVSAKEKAEFVNVGNQALLADIRALEAELDAEGYFKPSPLHALYRVTEIVCMHVIGLGFLYYAGTRTTGTSRGTAGDHFVDSVLSATFVLLGLITLGIAQGRCGWLQHEGGHYSLTGWMKLDKRLQQFIYGFGCGMAASWWSNQHNKHHATPQKVGHDVDLNTLPLVAFHTGAVTDTRAGQKLVAGPKQKQLTLWANYWLKNQAYLFSPLICLLVALFWQLYLHPRHSMRTQNYVELLWMTCRYVALFAFLVGSLQWSVLGSVMFYVVYVQLGASYIFTNFAVSHTHLDVVPEDDHRNWAEYASDHTMNCDSHFLTNWWMSFLNFQIEHHLWPQMPQFRFPKISPRVRAVFEKHGKEYKSLPYWEAIRITLKNLDEVAQEALEMTRTKID
ncbi:unnamed protein product [Amoebophrya sp. A120]|nr:unnamed protein product [Amoebophrya sp. A120]|eukprot:GSA120T00017958001.1